jgi:hypothetical protein
MNLGMFDIFCHNLKARAQFEERVDLNKFDRNRERYVIPMHRKSFWTNKWMQEPRKNFCRLQVQHRSNTMIPVRSTRKVGDHLKERED